MIDKSPPERPPTPDSTIEPAVIRVDYTRPSSHTKPIAFVKAQAAGSSVPSPTATDSASISSSYLSIVLPKASVSHAAITSANGQPDHDKALFCTVCNLPLEASSNNEDSIIHHESLLAHQVCLQHTHPPSAIDRTRKGLAYLQAYGWDPDARKGLGTIEGGGILHPISAKEKKNKAGIGAVASTKSKSKEVKAKVNIKQARVLAKGERKRSEKLRQMFYSNGDLEKYLGPDG